MRSRKEIADWLDARGIVWMGARAGKTPHSTRPKGDGDGALPWAEHARHGWLDEGRRAWIEHGGPVIVCPSTVRVGKHGAAVADVDEGELTANLAWLDEHVGSHPLLTYPRPDGAQKAHRWYACDAPRHCNGNMHFGTDEVVGQWRGIGGSGDTGGYVRLYDGEIEALIAAIESGRFGYPVSTAILARTAKPQARRSGRHGKRDWVAEIAALTKGRHPASVQIVTAALNAGVAYGDDTELAMRRAYLEIAPDTHGDAEAHWRQIWTDQARFVESSPPKRGRKRKATYDDVVKLVGGQSLASRLARYGIEIRYNVRWMLDEIRFEGGKWEPVTDRNEAHCRVMLLAMDWEDRVWRALWLNTLYCNSVDPVLEWLTSLPAWDGVPRVDKWCACAFVLRPGEDNARLAVWASRHLFLGSVKRTLEPGSHADTTPVLMGGQELGKSKHLEAVLPPWLRDAFGDELNLGARAKDMLEAIQGKVIVEIAEMSGLNRAKLDTLKAFLSRSVDSGIRLAYRRNPEVAPRRCIFVGTVNDDGTGVLPDDGTGNRRWCVIAVMGQGIHWDELMADREQYWAEALHRVRSGEDPAFPDELRQVRAAVNEMHRQADPMEQIVANNARPVLYRMKQGGNKDGLSVTELYELMGLRGSLGKDSDGNITGYRKTEAEVTRAEAMRLARALRAQGWGKRRVWRHGAKLWVWAPPAPPGEG